MDRAMIPPVLQRLDHHLPIGFHDGFVGRSRSRPKGLRIPSFYALHSVVLGVMDLRNA